MGRGVPLLSLLGERRAGEKRGGLILKMKSSVQHVDQYTPNPQPLPKWEGEFISLLSPVGERRVGEKRGRSHGRIVLAYPTYFDSI
jgi:hypothetical protein